MAKAFKGKELAFAEKGCLSGKPPVAGSNPVGPIAGKVLFPTQLQDKEWDIYNTKSTFLRQVKGIEHWSTTKSNKQEMLRFLRRIEMEGVGVVQRIKYIFAFKLFLKVVNKDFHKLKESDMEDFLYSMRQHYKQKTISTRWRCMKKFLRYIGEEDVCKNLMPKFSIKNRKMPEELLTEEEIKLMIKNATGIRNKAMVSLLYESGCRIGELLSRKLKHVVFDRLGAVLIVDGKTGMRRVRLINSVPLLANWIENHPQRDSPESFMWISQNDHKSPIKHRIVLKTLVEIAQKSGIKKKVHPHLFRHSRATILAKFLTEQELKIYFGWAGDSKAASTYIHLSGKDIEDKILELHGLKQPEKKEEILKPITCPRCERQNDSSARYCYRCGMMLQIAQPQEI